MRTLSKEERNQLSKAVQEAREVAETGARKALHELGVDEPDVPPHLDVERRKLRVKLRAQARQLGDKEDPGKKGRYLLRHLVEKVGYDRWHRMLFARFLSENELLISPQHGVAVSLAECEELALSMGLRNGWQVAASFAAEMLPQIFRDADPAEHVSLAPEDQNPLEQLVVSLPKEIFLADDALGWVYQFWQARRKEEVNRSEQKIGAEEVAPVTQLFTEDYMVRFLLDNTLGAWWCGKRRAEGKPEQLEGIDFLYLRRDEKGEPAAGSFPGWPKKAAQLRVLDPCMGSGHFLVFALPMLAAMRREEEQLSMAEAAERVLAENLFGLEIDPRCTQIAAFNLALAAWKLGGYRKLPKLNLACCGLGVNVSREAWMALAPANGGRFVMQELYELFEKAPVLGSLINAAKIAKGAFVDGVREVLPKLKELLIKAEQSEDENLSEMAVVAHGIADAAEMLTARYTLVATNVPYLGREGHSPTLVDFADSYAPDAVADLATLLLTRCQEFACEEGAMSVVLPQNWWVGVAYRKFRRRFLSATTWKLVAVLGEEAWQTFGNRGPNTILLVVVNRIPAPHHCFHAIDVSTKPGSPVIPLGVKARALKADSEGNETELGRNLLRVPQLEMLKTTNSRISTSIFGGETSLAEFVSAGEGSSTGDNDRFLRNFWEIAYFNGWLEYCAPGYSADTHCDSSLMLRWEGGKGALGNSEQARIQNQHLWNRKGVLVGRVRGITASIFRGGCYSKGAVLLCPLDDKNLIPIYCFLRSPQYEALVRSIDPRVSAATSVLTSVPFNIVEWRCEAAKKYAGELPSITSDDPTQWIFSGNPRTSDFPVHVAVSRLLNYRWPRQTGSSFSDCPALGPDGLEQFADDDGIVCISAAKGEQPAAERLRALLAAAFGEEWSAAKQQELLSQVGFEGKSLEDWLRNGFFEQHCKLFHQRPFIWQVWDGRKDGFSALINYHRIDRALLEKLIYAYLGDWISRQQAAVEAGEEGSDARLGAAVALKEKLELILRGEAPYDIFVRWKPIEEQPMGWEPDLNDGVRLNIRPFVTAGVLRKNPNINWKKDRGKDVQNAPWYHKFKGERTNDHHLTLDEKRAARAAEPGQQGRRSKEIVKVS